MRRTYPAGTGYERGLYNFELLPENARNLLENAFLGEVDGRANLALQSLLRGDANISVDLRQSWTRFVMSLFHRNPEKITRLRKGIEDELPPTIAKVEALWPQANGKKHLEKSLLKTPIKQLEQEILQHLLKNLIDSEMVGAIINKMIWRVFCYDNLRFPLLTSDRPYVMTNGWGGPDGHLALPISPSKIFFAAKNQAILRDLDCASTRQKVRFAEFANDVVAKQSHRFVWSNSREQYNFISKRIGQRQRATPVD